MSARQIGKQAMIDLSKIKVGDEVIVRAKVINVDLTDSNLPLRVDASGVGLWIHSADVASINALHCHAELVEALEGVIRVADRKTAEFDAARRAVAKARGEAP